MKGTGTVYHNFVYDDVSQALPRLLQKLETDGAEVGSRAGRTKELTHVGITLTNPWRREILVDHRKPSIAAQIAETAWVLAGRSDISWLVNYLPRVRDFSDDGKTWRAGYGKRLRDWNVDEFVDEGAQYGSVDQLAFVLDLLKRDPASRQAVMSIWDPLVDTKPGKDIPCNDWLSFSSRLGKLDLHVAVRSNDVVWGWSGINQFEWSALLEIVAGILGLEVGSLHFSTTSFHVYDHHWAKAHKIVEAAAITFPAARPSDSPRFDARTLRSRDLEGFDNVLGNWFEIEQMIREGNDEADTLVELFPEPMLRSWLRVLQWWWSGDRSHLQPLDGAALEWATHYSIQPPERERIDLIADENVVATKVVETPHKVHVPSAFVQYAIDTHNEKHAAYGDSWKRRGEMLGIMANIARKIDRLGGAETSDETSADTAMDLMVYLAKYRVWLGNEGKAHDFDPSDFPESANELMLKTEQRITYGGQPVSSEGKEESWLKEHFDVLEHRVNEGIKRHGLVEDMVAVAYVLARHLWEAAQPADAYLGADHD